MGDHQCSQDFHSVQFSRSVSDSLQRNELQHTRFPSASPTPGVAQTHIHRVGDAIHRLVLCHPLLLLPSIFPSIRVFSSESVLRIRWPKYWSFSFSISPSHEYSGLISFRMDWLDLVAVQGTLKSLRQQHSSKVLILWCPAFFILQLSHPYMTTGKTMALTRRTFVGKVMSLLFNMLSRLVTRFVGPYFPDCGLNPGPWQWKHQALAIHGAAGEFPWPISFYLFVAVLFLCCCVSFL